MFFFLKFLFNFVIHSNFVQLGKWKNCGIWLNHARGSFLRYHIEYFHTHTQHETWGQFHQHFTSSFYAQRFQKRKKDSQLKQLFALLGSAGIKAAHKHVDEIDPSFYWRDWVLSYDLIFFANGSEPSLRVFVLCVKIC